MKLSKTLIASSIAAVMATSVVAPVQAEVEVGASVGVANMYYWRGQELGNGTPAVSGDLNISTTGFYGGIWGSSGDTAAGSEYDLYVGYGASLGDFSVDLSAWTYVYPSKRSLDVAVSGASGEIRSIAERSEPGDLSEVILGLGYGPVAVTYYDNIAGDTGYWYGTLALELGAFGFTYGLQEDDYAHFDVSYAFNDNLVFTIGTVVDDVDAEYDDDTKFVVSYTLPLGE